MPTPTLSLSIKVIALQFSTHLQQPPSISRSLSRSKSQRLPLSPRTSLSLSRTEQARQKQRMADDWDLQAVVRGCSSSTTTAASCSLDVHPPSSNHFLFFPDPLEPRTSVEELDDLFKPFFPKSQPLTAPNKPISPLSVLTRSQGPSPPPPPPPPPPPQQQQRQSVADSRAVATTSTTPRSKKRKNQMKRVCEVPVEGLSCDMWSWRKYGQKPIKGSPYPRGYYRCSTSKGCLARKQVERNRSDPGMFIVTYTAEHNHPMPTHRNSLAGSTRQKTVTPETIAAAGETNQPSCSPPVSPASVSPATEKTESREERDGDEDDEFGVSDMAISDDFFEGLEELTTGPATEDCLPDHLPTSLTFPWLANNAATTAAGGGG